MIYVGIDVGLRSGAVAAIDHNSVVVGCADIPSVGDRVNVIALHRMILDMIGTQDFHITIEEVGVMPKQGISSTGLFMRAAGAIETVALLLTKDVLLVRPTKWKKIMKVTSEKDTSLTLARELFPAASLKRKKDHGRAEALLLAEYGRRQS